MVKRRGLMTESRGPSVVISKTDEEKSVKQNKKWTMRYEDVSLKPSEQNDS